MIIAVKTDSENKVCFKKDCFLVELAETAEEKSKGLMFREELAKDHGMLFVFTEETKSSFWMKNTLIPLDIIWLNKDKEVVFISRNNQPCLPEECFSINPGVAAKYVLELNAGTVAAIGLVVGDKANFNL